jgi:hypothetical protein
MREDGEYAPGHDTPTTPDRTPQAKKVREAIDEYSPLIQRRYPIPILRSLDSLRPYAYPASPPASAHVHIEGEARA